MRTYSGRTLRPAVSGGHGKRCFKIWEQQQQ